MIIKNFALISEDFQLINIIYKINLNLHYLLLTLNTIRDIFANILNITPVL